MQLIYIAGSGRNGSTLVERALCSGNAAFGAGEIHCLWRLPLEQLTCACGLPLRSCEFWAAILRELDSTWFHDMRQLEASVVRNRFLYLRDFDLSRIRSMPGVLRFTDLQQRLLSRISELSDCPIVIDSSKAGPRAWLLAAHCQPSIVHLYRNCPDVLASWRSSKFDRGLGTDMKRKPIHAAAIDWIKIEQSMRFLAQQYPVSFLNYGDFTAEPHAHLDSLMDAISPGLSRNINWLSQNEIACPRNYHSVNGNPDRFETASIVIQSRSSLDKLTPFERRLCLGFGGALGFVFPPTKSMVHGGTPV